MTDQRYPVDLVVLAQDFVDSGWKEVLAATSREGYSAMWQAFSAAARGAIDEGRDKRSKVLWLLADACHLPFAIYAWWLGLRLVFNTWWNTAHRNSADEEVQNND